VSSNAQGNTICDSPSILLYIEGQAPDTNLNPAVVGSVGGSQPHTNFQPYLCVDFIISLFGIFPTPT
jgi:microcystin-dependent protein